MDIALLEMDYVKSGLNRGPARSLNHVPSDFIAKCVFDHLTNPFHELSTYSSNTIRTINRSWITSLALSFITLCPSYHFFSWDLRRDRASNYIRSIEIGANVKMNYVVVVVWWYTGSWIIWSVSWSMTRMAFFFSISSLRMDLEHWLVYGVCIGCGHANNHHNLLWLRCVCSDCSVG